jgi:SAM-dependent methyltransferase
MPWVQTVDLGAVDVDRKPLGTRLENARPASENQSFYDKIAYDYDRSYHTPSEPTRLRDRIESDFIISNLVRNGRTLEVGPGQGRFTQSLAENSEMVLAVDVSKKMLDICKMRTMAKNVVYEHMDLIDLDEQRISGMFDTIVAMWVIPHLDDGAAAMRKLGSLLKPNGRLIFDLWNSSSIRARQIGRTANKPKRQTGESSPGRDLVYTRYYTYGEMLVLPRRAGLTPICERGWCLVPIMSCRGGRLLLPVYKYLDESLQTSCKRYYYARLFCCRPD